MSKSYIGYVICSPIDILFTEDYLTKVSGISLIFENVLRRWVDNQQSIVKIEKFDCAENKLYVGKNTVSFGTNKLLGIIPAQNVYAVYKSRKINDFLKLRFEDFEKFEQNK